MSAYPTALLILARSRVREQLRKQGMSFIDAIQLSNSITSEHIDAAASEAGAIPDFSAPGGSIIDLIIQFLTSSTGQALIALLIKLLLGG